jgi:hypothetical protein
MHMHQQHDQQEQRRWQTVTGRLGMAAALVMAGAVLLTIGCFGATAMPTAHAVPMRRSAPASAAPATLAPVQIVSKTILPETSIAGPSFTGTDIGWAGTDAAHHLNIRGGTGGLQFPTKITLPETSPVGPDVIETVDHGSALSVVLAWTGTDANHSLNIQVIPDGQKLTLHESSLGTPAMQFINNPNGTPDTVILAWTGTDTNHSLNVMPVKVGFGGPEVPGTKTVLRQFSSDAGPSLGGTGTGLVLGWSVRGTQRLNLATSTDNVHFTSTLGSGLPQTSANAPQFGVVQGPSINGCIAWTGTDAAHHLNVQCSTQFPQFPDPAQSKTVLPETALGAPGFTGSEIAWTGTDRAHHLNVAQLKLP